LGSTSQLTTNNVEAKDVNANNVEDDDVKKKRLGEA